MIKKYNIICDEETIANILEEVKGEALVTRTLGSEEAFLGVVENITSRR